MCKLYQNACLARYDGEDDPLYPVYVQFERFRAAQYSRELSDKVWRGCTKIAEQGYWTGGKPPYSLQRLLLDENREPVHPLEAGQRKMEPKPEEKPKPTNSGKNRIRQLFLDRPGEVITREELFFIYGSCHFSRRIYDFRDEEMNIKFIKSDNGFIFSPDDMKESS